MRCKYCNNGVILHTKNSNMNYIKSNWISISSVLFSFIALYFSLAKVEFCRDDLIITFFGVIASIVVIGNLTQVYRIEDRFKENQNILQGKLNDIKKLTIELDTIISKLQSKVTKLENEILALKNKK